MTALLARLVLALALALPASAASASEPVRVFAASSLTDALDAAAERWERTTGGQTRIVYASSSTLARQIAQGAPADLFISANVQWMDYLAERGLVREDTRTRLFGNRLVLVAPAGGGEAGDIGTLGPDSDLAGMLGEGRLALGDPDHVPAGIYARAALEGLGAWDALAPRLARADNVRAALALVARGEAPYGIVYRSDAVAEDDVRVAGIFSADAHPPIVYPAALVAAAERGAAREFLAFLEGPDAQGVFAEYGFEALP